jgi:DNA-binding LacI/PurR family transcriptional regulator
MTGMHRRPTHQDIAAIARVSQVTVSLALRSHPRIPEATRKRIEEIALQIGYRPDPMLSSLVAYRHSARASVHQGTLAWIDDWKPARQPFIEPGFKDYWNGALERCAELGYKLEVFPIETLGITVDRLSRILRARNIQGMLLAPQSRSRAHLNLDWGNFSVVTFGFSLVRPRFHLVTDAQFRASVTAVRKLRSLGYRRIGCVLEHPFDERTDHNFSGGFLSEQRRFPKNQQIPFLSISGWSAPTAFQQFETWYKRHRPEAIITIPYMVQQWMKKMGHDAGNDYALAGLTLSDKRSEFAGIYQNGPMIGRTAVDILVGMIHRNERGIPEIPMRILIEGSWLDGKSVRRLIPSGLSYKKLPRVCA